MPRLAIAIEVAAIIASTLFAAAVVGTIATFAAGTIAGIIIF